MKNKAHNHPCDVEGCHEIGEQYHYPDSADIIYACPGHAQRFGFCWNCRDFFGGTEAIFQFHEGFVRTCLENGLML